MKATKGRRSAGNLFRRSPGNPATSRHSEQRSCEAYRCRILRDGLSREKRREVIAAYLAALQRVGGSVAAESDLPNKKDTIRMAILQEMVENPNADMKGLEIAYAQLESFLPDDEFKVIADFKNASLRAQEMVESGDPIRIISSARVMEKMEGDRAVRIQEKISEKIHQRMAEIQEIIAAGGGRTCVLGDAELICV